MSSSKDMTNSSNELPDYDDITKKKDIEKGMGQIESICNVNWIQILKLIVGFVLFLIFVFGMFGYNFRLHEQGTTFRSSNLPNESEVLNLVLFVLGVVAWFIPIGAGCMEIGAIATNYRYWPDCDRRPSYEHNTYWDHHDRYYRRCYPIACLFYAVLLQPIAHLVGRAIFYLELGNLPGPIFTWDTVLIGSFPILAFIALVYFVMWLGYKTLGYYCRETVIR